MAHRNTVLRSVNLDVDRIYVDILLRPDGTYGFDEYRRDPEDARGWYSVGHHGDRVFDNAEAAMSEARRLVAWFGTEDVDG